MIEYRKAYPSDIKPGAEVFILDDSGRMAPIFVEQEMKPGACWGRFVADDGAYQLLQGCYVREGFDATGLNQMQRAALEALSDTVWRSCVDLGFSLITLRALVEMGRAEVRHEPGAMDNPRKFTKFRAIK